MQDIVIFGTGGFAREVLQIVLDLNEERPRWNFLGFLDDNGDVHGSEIHGFPVLGGSDWLESNGDVFVSIGIGSTPVRRKIDLRLRAQQVRFASLIHPRAWVGRQVSVDEGLIVCAGTMVTTDIQFGRQVILNLDCTVGHDAVLGDYVTAAPSTNISGNVTIGDGCDLGTGSTIIQGIEIGSWTIVGAGAVVVKPLPPNVTAVGAPAKPIKEREPGWHE